MKFGLAKGKITPDLPVFMHGFGMRDHKSEGVHDDVYVKAALLESNKRLLILTLDALGSDHSFTVGMKDELRKKFGLLHDEVLINFSHTHASVFLTGPDESLRRGDYSIEQEEWADDPRNLDFTRDVEYYRFIRDTVIRLVEICLENMTEGEITLLIGSANLAVSRRVVTANGTEWRPNYAAEYDRDLFVLKLTDYEHRIKGILYVYGCHTTSMSGDNYRISGDFTGMTSRCLEKDYPGAIAMFLQGCGAELKPLKSASGDRFKSCNYAEMEEIGEDLAKEVSKLLDEGKSEPIRCHFKSVLSEPRLFTESLPLAAYEKIADDTNPDHFIRKAAKRTLQAIRDGSIKDRLPIYISLWQLDSRTQIIAIEGEVSTEYSILLKKLFHDKKTIVLGYSNAVNCYIPTRKMIREGGYEAECNYFFGLRGPFVPEAEDIIVGRIVKMEAELSRQEDKPKWR